ncbi:MAG: NAD(P)-binding domain-containing protein [Thermoanaerobaculia bacterium]|nr:NAD(P)-binding domain-containing protein [Thermoanaerobaculia bacterium]
MSSSTTHDPVCIIGAGSSGIVAAKVLQEHGLTVEVFEKGSEIGGNWRFRNDNGQSAAYASLHINTSKTRMAFSDFPMPDDYPPYPHHSQILAYFQSYVSHFGLRPAIRFQTEVAEVIPDGEGWRVRLASGEQRRYRAVLVANGHHWCPKLPSFPGEFHGRCFHSHAYKNPAGLEGKRVLVVGIGNSGVDIACEVSRVASQAFLSTRRSAYVLPKFAFGRPIDLFTTPLSSHLPKALQLLAFKLILRTVQGPQEAFGVPRPRHGLLEAHPTVSQDLLNLVGHGRIKIKPNLERLAGDRVVFDDGSEEPIDVIIYATGYHVRFPFLAQELVDTSENEVALYRHAIHPRLPRLFFIGLLQPLGAVMPLAEAQSKWVAKLLTGECTLPDAETMERTIARDRAAMRRRYVDSPRHTLQVDFFPYLETIDREIRRGRRLAMRAR